MDITVNSIELRRAVGACKFAASKDRHRPNLECVYVRAFESGDTHVFATNGRWLFAVRLPSVKVENPGLVGLSPKLVKAVCVKPEDENEETSIIVDDSHTYVSTPDRELRELTVDATLAPPVHTVVPNKKAERVHGRPWLSSELLVKVAKAFEAASGNRVVPMSFYSMGSSSLDGIVVWSSGVPNAFALMMPMRVSEKRDMAWWFEHATQIEKEVAAGEKSAA